MLSQDERTLQQAGIALDTASLLDYFRRRTPTPEEQTVLEVRAHQLGSKVYAARARATDELIRAGRASLPWLRAVAKDADAETVRRAQYCIKIIEQNTHIRLSATASRVLADRQVKSAVDVLLPYLPLVDEPWAEEEICQCLRRLAVLSNRKTAPSILAALKDPRPKCRAAAAWIVGQSEDPEERQRAFPCLNDDYPEVCFRAASALVSTRESAAVPALIHLLSDSPADLAWRSEDLLFRVAGESGPAVWLDAANDNNGSKVRDAWEQWWKTNQGRVDWKSLRMDEEGLGLTLIVENQRGDGVGRIYECNSAGAIRWQVRVQNPIDAQWLPGGRLLVADSRSSIVCEMDTRGFTTWKHTGLAPTSCQRLPNGNTVISTYQSVVEFSREGKIIFSHNTQGHTYHARKLADGHYVWIDACGEITSIDEKGKELAKFKVGNGLTWGSVEGLRNGHFLVALGGVNKVQEIDLSGRVFWERAVNNPNRALRLANGNILVASHGDQCIYEFDAKGEQRWKHECNGRPFAARRR